MIVGDDTAHSYECLIMWVLVAIDVTHHSYEFYDQIVSGEVQTVCQALATDDRLGPFTPCFVRR